MNDVRERFLYILERLYDNNQSRFAAIVGTTQGYIGNIVNRGSKPSIDILTKTVEICNISAEWLLTGKGEMLKDNEDISIGRIGGIRNKANITKVTGNVIDLNSEYNGSGTIMDSKIEKLEKTIIEKDMIIKMKDELLKAKDESLKAKDEAISALKISLKQ